MRLIPTFPHLARMTYIRFIGENYNYKWPFKLILALKFPLKIKHESWQLYLYKSERLPSMYYNA